MVIMQMDIIIFIAFVVFIAFIASIVYSFSFNSGKLN